MFDCLVQFPGDKPVCTGEQGQQPLDHNETRRDQNQPSKLTARENQQNYRASPVPMVENNTDSDGKMDNKLIDLNSRPQRIHGQNSTNQVLTFSNTNHALYLQVDISSNHVHMHVKIAFFYALILTSTKLCLSSV